MENSKKTIKLIDFKQVKPISLEEMNEVFKRVETLPEKSKSSSTHLDFNELISPSDDGKPRSHFELLEETHQVALPRLLRLMDRYPQNSFITIGMSSIPVNRDSYYDSYPDYFRRDSFVPKLKIEDQILFRSKNKFNVLMVEYLMQFHLAEGLWKEHFIDRTNPQRRLLPHLPDREIEPKDYFVYAKFSKKSSTFSIKTKKGNGI